MSEETLKGAVSQIRAKMMSVNGAIEPQNCILFGKAYGQKLGVHVTANNSVGANYHRLTNQLVIGSTGTGKTYNYMTPNLYQGTSSAVVIDICADFLKFKTHSEVFKKRGIKTHFMNFCEGAKETARFNPFLHAKYFGDTKYQQANHLAELIMNSMMPIATKELPSDPFLQKLTKEILSVVILYILEGNMPDNKRTFKTLVEILRDKLNENPLKELELLIALSVTPTQEGIDQMLNLCYSGASEKSMKDCIICLLIGLQLFLDSGISRCFEEEADTDNIDLTAFGTEQHYLFLCAEPYEWNGKILGFVIAMLNDGFMKVRPETFNVRHIQFYLDEFSSLSIPQFINRYAVCRKYNMGFSVLVQNAEILKKNFGDDWQMIPANSEAVVLMNGGMYGLNTELLEKLCHNNSEAQSDMEKYILQNAEKFGSEKVIAFVYGEPPILCERLDPNDYRA